MNMGCGRNLKQGWINIDLGQEKCFNLEFRERFPFSNGIVSQIYSEHMLEHLAFPDEALTFISESFRLLSPGGPRWTNSFRELL